MFYLDTNICIDFLRGKTPELYKHFKNMQPTDFGIPAVVYAELLTGAQKSTHPKKMLQQVKTFVAPFSIVPFDGKCAMELGKTRAYLERRGTKIGIYDLFIAATALANNAVVITNNVREFQRVPNLHLETWDVVELEP